MENLENKTQETTKKKQSLFDKIMSKTIIPLAIISVGYLAHTHVCSRMYDHYINQRNNTPAYQELVKISQEMKDLTSIDKNYNTYLSEEGKKAIEQRITVLTEKKGQLIPEIKPYEEKADKWIQRGLNPLEYLKN
ncbi:MAG: hypothetical protein Q8O03_05810 [Nanoarchaeota archaeon]|nr:hypothetical protein [Nanoarchaeota archaeon]